MVGSQVSMGFQSASWPDGLFDPGRLDHVVDFRAFCSWKASVGGRGHLSSVDGPRSCALLLEACLFFHVSTYRHVTREGSSFRSEQTQRSLRCPRSQRCDSNIQNHLRHLPSRSALPWAGQVWTVWQRHWRIVESRGVLCWSRRCSLHRRQGEEEVERAFLTFLC